MAATALPNPTATAPRSSCSYSFACTFNKPRPCLPAATRRHHYLRQKLSCRANGEQPQDGSSLQLPKLDRRDVLIGLGGLYGAAGGLGLDYDRKALAAPVQAPDLSTCVLADTPGGKSNCCPPYKGEKALDFVRPPSSAPLRVRQAAHLVDADYVAKYTKAVELMKALPDDDPRSFRQQANVHCAYCNGAYHQIGFPNLEFKVHGSWIFFPFHRLYLYFHERILGKLIGDETFALPFWNWDAPAGMSLPSIYNDPSSSLYDANRQTVHLPPSILDFNYGNPNAPTIPEEETIKQNLTTMYRQVFYATKAQLFMGDPFRAGDTVKDDPRANGGGTMENVPHGTVHIWTGKLTDDGQVGGEDMGSFYSSARDPIFYAHHANVDRTWSIWKSLDRQDFDDDDWLDASFLLYDENADLIRVRVRDCLDTTWLRYSYQDVEIPWLDTRPTSQALRAKSRSLKARTPPAEATFPVSLDKSVTATVKRPKISRTRKEKEAEEEVLVIEGIEFDRDYFVKFDVFINDAEGVVTAAASEFAGTFLNVPHSHDHKKDEPKMRSSLRLGISQLLEDIGADDDDTLLVRIVPRTTQGKVTIGGLRIELLK